MLRQDRDSLAPVAAFAQSPNVIRFAVLGSGSGGNSAVVECGGTRIMVDAGLSAKQLTLRLELLGIDPASLDGILLTHEHGDHIRGLRVFTKKHQIPIYATAQTSHIVREVGIDNATWKTFETGQHFHLGDIHIQSFSIQHDAIDPVGFVLANETKKLGFVSDAGFVTRSMTENLRGLHGLFIESNYDDDLLEADTKRPWSIKQRISSRHGHLSNTQVNALIRDIAHQDLSRIVLGHLSSDCNSPDVAIDLLRKNLTELGHHHIGLHCAEQAVPTEWFTI